MDANSKSACSRYALKAKARFHYGPGKCCVMNLGNSDMSSLSGEQCMELVHTKRFLGILVDDALTFSPCLKEALGRGWDAFVQLFNSAETAGFPLSVIAEEAYRRVVPEFLFAAPFLVSTQGFEHELNKLQWKWGRVLLGASHDFALPWALVFTQCGWPLRLGSYVIEGAAVALARLLVLPEGHPGALFVRMALSIPCHSWTQDVLAILQCEGLPSRIPLVFEAKGFDSVQLEAARSSSSLRKDLLRRYRLEIVRPILLEYDRAAGEQARGKLLPGFTFSFEDLGRSVGLGEVSENIRSQTSPGASLWLRCWAIIGITGAWPLCLFQDSGLPLCLDSCSLCGARYATVLHAFAECPGTQCVLDDAAAAVCLPERTEGQSLAFFLLKQHQDVRVTLACQKVVGTCMQLLCSNISQ